MLYQFHSKANAFFCTRFLLTMIFILLFYAVLKILLLHFTLYSVKDGLIIPNFYQVFGSVIASFLMATVFTLLIYSLIRIYGITKNPYLVLLSLTIAAILSAVLFVGTKQETIKEIIIQQNSYSRPGRSEKQQTLLENMRSEIYTLSIIKRVETKTKKILADSLGNMIRSYFKNERCCSPAAQKSYQSLCNKLIKQQSLTDSCKYELLDMINKYDLLKSSCHKEIDDYFAITKFSFHKQITSSWSRIKSEKSERSLLIILFLGYTFLLLIILTCRKNKKPFLI